MLEICFDIEKVLFGKAAMGRGRTAPVFVCGLARAGTTILTRALHQTGAFASLSYRDLPFPLAPNAWARASSRAARNLAATERGHGDGMLHDLDSPEAIEEVFWRCFEGPRYLLPQGLIPVAPESETLAAFADYLGMVALRHDRPRYLSKNNNNILRLGALVATFPDAALLHPFRDPFQQAASLLGQHLRACELARADPFRCRFMTWLGHHEFGADQRPFLLNAAPDGGTTADTFDYWLAAWIAAYRHLLDQPRSVAARQHFLNFDALCQNPEAAVAVLATAAGVDLHASALTGLHLPRSYALPRYSRSLASEATAVHSELVARMLRD